MHCKYDVMSSSLNVSIQFTFEWIFIQKWGGVYILQILTTCMQND